MTDPIPRGKTSAGKKREGRWQENKEGYQGHCHCPDEHKTHHSHHTKAKSKIEINEEVQQEVCKETHHKTHSCRQQQRFALRCQKERASPIQKKIAWEREREEHRRAQVVRAIEWRVMDSYGFHPASHLSTHMNARQVLGDMSPGCYFLKGSNSAFHDLTKDQAIPPMAASLLGLGLKFIPTPETSPSVNNITPSLNRIERDINLKTFFAG